MKSVFRTILSKNGLLIFGKPCCIRLSLSVFPAAYIKNLQMEGQQRFDTQSDNLMNYIRYWAAEGESIKTSIRASIRQGQMVLEGHFCGGVAPYGYRQEKQGRKNVRGHKVQKILVDEDEAPVVAHIFELPARNGHGSRRIATMLTEEGYRNRDGQVVLSGNVFCGTCGGRLISTTVRRTHHATESYNPRIPVYRCYNRIQRKDLCDGQSIYRADKVDAVVEAAVCAILNRVRVIDQNDYLKKRRQQELNAARVKLRQLESAYGKVQNERKRLNGYIMDALSAAQGLCPVYQNAAMEEKRRIVSALIERVTVSRRYDVHIQFHVGLDVLNNLDN